MIMIYPATDKIKFEGPRLRRWHVSAGIKGAGNTAAGGRIAIVNWVRIGRHAYVIRGAVFKDNRVAFFDSQTGGRKTGICIGDHILLVLCCL